MNHKPYSTTTGIRLVSFRDVERFLRCSGSAEDAYSSGSWKYIGIGRLMVTGTDFPFL